MSFAMCVLLLMMMASGMVVLVFGADPQSYFAIKIAGLNSPATVLLDTTNDPSWCCLQQHHSEWQLLGERNITVAIILMEGVSTLLRLIKG